MPIRRPLPSAARVALLLALALAAACGGDDPPGDVTGPGGSRGAAGTPAGTPAGSGAPGPTATGPTASGTTAQDPAGPGTTAPRSIAPGGLAAHGATGHAVAAPPIPARDDVPASMATCALCHAGIVEDYLAHGMSDALGPVGELPAGHVSFGGTSRAGATYEITPDGRFTTRFADGGLRTQRVVGRLGAGVFSTSLVVADEVPGRPGTTDHLFFAPQEFLTGHGWAAAPFLEFAGSAGAELAITAECLACHSETDTTRLPGVAPGPGGQVYPRHVLGTGALEATAPLDCGTCHGDTSAHAERMFGPRASDQDLGLVRFGDLDLGTRRDRCARCHLEGEARIELTDLYGGRPREDRPLMALRPVLVPTEPTDDFRFVGQLERLSLSRCFTESPAMDCVSCHDPHRAVAAQGTADFDARCLACHPADDDGTSACVRPPGLAVADVTGAPARTDDGCVDCHVRRSQPYDLGHLRTADHFVRRRIPLPETLRPRPNSGAGPGGWAVWDDGRLADVLATPDGERWHAGVAGFAAFKHGHLAEAREAFARFAAPGSEAATTPTAPAPLHPLESTPVFHFTRGLVLEATGDADAARAAYGDALRLDPAYPEALLNRAGLRLAAGDVPGALDDLSLLLLHHPGASKAWNLRAQAAAALGDVASAAEALVASAELWPVDPVVLRELGRAWLRLGRPTQARATLERVRQLQPSQPGLLQDLQAAGGTR